MNHFNKYLNMKYDERQNIIYYISDESGIHNLWKYDLDNDEKVQVTDEDQNINDYWLEPNDNIVAIDYNGNERHQLYSLENQNDLNPLIKDEEYFHHYGTYDENQDGYYIIRNHHDSSAFELCLIKRTEELKVLYDFDAPVVILSSIENNQLLLTYENSNIMKQLYIFNTDSLKVEKLPIAPSRFLSFTNVDGKDYAYCLSDWETGFINVYKLNLIDWSYQRLTSFSWDIEHIVWSERYDQATVIVNENGCSKLYNFDVDTGDITEIEFRNDVVIHSIQKRDENQLLILFSSVDVPHCIVNYNLQSNTYSTLVENNGTAETINWKMHSYKSFDGLDVPYFMYESENVGKAPTLIYIHGGPESQERPEFKELYYQLQQQGISIVIPNIRGSKGYGRYYLELDNQIKRLDAMKDVLSLRENLISNHDCDKDNISLMGISYGGFMTLLLITHHPELWRSAIDIVGISHLKTFLTNTSPWRRKQRSSEYGVLGKHDEFFEEISPLPRAKDIQVPLLVFHSVHDTRVPNSESVQLVESMKNNNQHVMFTSYENEGHIYKRKENLDDMERKIKEFLGVY
ncbi:alpha/beta hydrolase family protein [Salinicoccus sp. Marseille-QA3877]